jgi:hypothetical protein
MERKFNVVPPMGGKSTYNIGDLYNLYNKCKVYTLIKIINEESELMFYEDNEEADTSTEEGDIEVSL